MDSVSEAVSWTEAAQSDGSKVGAALCLLVLLFRLGRDRVP